MRHDRVLVNAVPFDPELSDAIANATADGTSRVLRIEMPWYRQMGSVRTGSLQAAYRATFGPPLEHRNLEFRTAIWTFERDGAIVYALVSERGVDWEWPGTPRWKQGDAIGDPEAAWSLIRWVQRTVLTTTRSAHRAASANGPRTRRVSRGR